MHWLAKFILASALLCPIPSWATTYWVATTGSNANACASIDGDVDPGVYRQTIVSGLSCLAAGDSLVVKAGTYTDEINNIPSGTGPGFTGATTLRANTGDSVIVQPTAAGCVPGDRPLIISGKTSIIVKDMIFDATNCINDAVKVETSGGGTKSTFIRLENVTGRNALNQGILIIADDFECLNCIAHGNGDSNLDHGLYL